MSAHSGSAGGGGGGTCSVSVSQSQKRRAACSPPHSPSTAGNTHTRACVLREWTPYTDQNDPPEPTSADAGGWAAASTCTATAAVAVLKDQCSSVLMPQPLGVHNPPSPCAAAAPVALTDSAQWARAYPWLERPQVSAATEPSPPPSATPPPSADPTAASSWSSSAAALSSAVAAAAAAPSDRWEAMAQVAPRPRVPLRDRQRLSEWLPSCAVAAYEKQGVTGMYPWQAAALETAEKGENLVREAKSLSPCTVHTGLHGGVCVEG
jgi:hypothetical protein